MKNIKIEAIELYKKHPLKFRIFGIIGTTTGLAWLIYQINHTKLRLKEAVDISITDIYEPKASDKPIFEAVEWIQQPIEKKSSHFFKFMYARRLMSVAMSDCNLSLKNRAIDHLAKLKNLNDWQYTLIGHMCDARVAVGMARTYGVDDRFFLQPVRKYGKYNHVRLMHAIKEYIKALSEVSEQNHPCIEKFISRFFFYDASRIFDHTHGTEELTQYVQTSSEYMIPMCLESIKHHSSINKYAKDVVINDGLYLLMEIYQRFSDNIGINITICNIIANISVFPDLLQDLFASGWVTVLGQFLKSPDIRVSGPAAQALANLDRVGESDELSPGNVYILSPLHRSTHRFNVDVVFVHGLLGGVFYTWRNKDKEDVLGLIASITHESHNDRLIHSSVPDVQEYLEEYDQQNEAFLQSIERGFEIVMYDLPESANETAQGPFTLPSTHKAMTYDVTKTTQCWPRDWLPHDCQHLRIIGINYNTKISMWSENCPEMAMKTDLDARSTDLMNNLTKIGVGKRPIVWVVHSMGGLIVKNILNKANKDDQDIQNLCSQTKAIVFYSTPHFGSKTATINQPTSYLMWPSVEVRELREHSNHLNKLHANFLEIYEKFPMKVISFIETNPTQLSALKLNLFLVEAWSANPGIGDLYNITADHLSICKPTNRQSFLYQKTLEIIRNVAEVEEKKYKSKKYEDLNLPPKQNNNQQPFVVT